MKALTIDVEQIIQSMRDLCRETNEYYLDCASGRVVALSRKLLKFLSSEPSELQNELPEWDARLIPTAREIVVTASPNYLRIPEAFGCPEHKWMAEFTETIRGSKLRSKLSQVLRGRGSCFRFKTALKENAEEFNRWVVFRQKKWEDNVQKWLEKYAIIAVPLKPQKKRAAA